MAYFYGMVGDEMFTIVKKGIKKHFGTYFGITIILFLTFTMLFIGITINKNSGDYEKSELERLGYGDITAWVSNVNNIENLKNEINKLDSVKKVDSQDFIISGYSLNKIHSDNEGQLLKYDREYKIFTDDLTGYKELSSIKNNEIYISPVMKATFNAEIGQTIEFEISRTGETKKFQIVGYFEDPFMGSSMVDMKSFLISDSDFNDLVGIIKQDTSIDILARNGAMLHISRSNQVQNINEFNMELNTHTNIANHTEFVYTNETIYSFMMLVQNIFIGFLLSFVVVLLIVSIIIISHNISNTIENDKKDFGILKTVGFTSFKLRITQIMQYGIAIFIGLVFSVVGTKIILNWLTKPMINLIGIRLPSNIPVLICFIFFVIILLLLISVIVIKTKKISEIKPIEIISDNTNNQFDKKIYGTINKDDLSFDLAVRQLVSERKRYVGIFIISILLTFFVLIVARLDSWLGPNGEGLMNAFSVADHDLGVQPLRHVDMNEVQNIIKQYGTIQNAYSIAMQPVTVNGIDYTANVLDNTNWFHILKGKTVQNDDEIVITDMVANDLNVNIGDVVTINHEHQFTQYKIVGIYMCANSMGANIGMSKDGYAKIGNVNSYIWCYHFILSDHTHNEEIMKLLQEKYPMQMDVHTNSWSGLDGIVSTMNLLVIFMYSIVAIFILIVVALTTSRLLNFEQKELGIYKVLGFTSKKLRKIFASRYIIVTMFGAIIGLILSELLAEKLILQLVKLFGVGEFISNISIINTVLPVLILVLLFGIFSYLLSRKIKKVSLIDLIKN